MPVSWTQCVLNTTDILNEILAVIFYLVTFSDCISSSVIIVIQSNSSFINVLDQLHIANYKTSEKRK